jgi:hypothetical protein
MRSLAILGLAAGIWLVWPKATPAAPASVAPSAGPVEEVAPATATLQPDPRPVPAANSPDPSRALVLPDGTAVPCLNGAHDCESLARAWGNWPWSPIVGVQRSDVGVEWYVHADGSRSTTEMKFRSDLGRDDAITRVAHPGDAPPDVKH